MRRIIDTVKRYDAITLFCVSALLIIGMVFVYSAAKSFDGSAKFVIVQGGAAIIGLIAVYFVTIPDYDDILKFWRIIVGVSLFLLVLVLLIGQGKDSTGTKGWIRFAGIGIQPAELVKIGFIMTLSKHLDSIDDVNDIHNVLMLLLHLAIPVGLIMLQPDLGTALVFIFIFIVLVFIKGINFKYIISAVISGVVICISAWLFFLNSIQKERILAFIYPESAPTTYGYHVMQSKIAIGSGGIAGKGLFKGIQTQLGILPEKHTDFIYAVIGEEGGFILSLIVVILFVVLLIRTVNIAKNAKTDTGSFIVLGVTAMWLFHFLENIGMTIGLMPVTGIPLPFISYGGSSLVTNFIALGLVLNVYMRKKTISFF